MDLEPAAPHPIALALGLHANAQLAASTGSTELGGVTVLRPCKSAHPEEPALRCTLPLGHPSVPDPGGEPLTFDHANPARKSVWVQYEVASAAA